ncbi:MAG: 50S ribosomal protein L28 [Aquificaceae bacterium]
MAVCAICGKKTSFGKSVTFSAEQNSRTFKPNLQRVRVKMPDGSIRRIWVCTKCLKAGKVNKVASC